MSTQARSTPSTGLAIAAASLPLVFLVLSCPLSIIALPSEGLRGFWYSIQEAGPSVWLVFGSALVAVVALGALLAFAAKGRRVPAVLAIGFAGLPWLFGLLGALWGMSQARAVIEYADSASRATLMARGIAEATNNAFFGAALSSALFSATGLAFAIAALAQRAPGRRGIGALLGGVAMVPLLGVALFAASAVRITSALELVLAALGAVITAALGGLAVGEDVPHGRSGALGAAACVASGLGVSAAIAVAVASGTMEAFNALAFAAPDSRAELLAYAAAELAPASIASFAALPVALLAAAVVAGLAALRARPTPGRIAGAVALVVLAAAFASADALVGGRADALLTEAMSLTR